MLLLGIAAAEPRWSNVDVELNAGSVASMASWVARLPNPAHPRFDTAGLPLLASNSRAASNMNRDERESQKDQVKGKAKQAWGDLTDNERLRDEGRADEAKGEVQEGFGKAKRKVGETIEDMKR